MADEIEDDGPHASDSSSYLARAATSIQNSTHASASRQPGQTSSRPQPQPGLDRQSGAPAPSKTGVVQPKPQALAKRSGTASIIVSPRQKGNPVLERIKSMPWEYGDIPADYILGLTTCCLFLSLKYHRLHPEYIYNRIKSLQGKYALRIVLCMVDIQNHEESLKELNKTSVINNVTIVLCWSAAEGARYLELFKTYENAAPTSIKQHQSTAYSDRMVDFVTTPRSVNKTDAVSLVSQFGTVRTAVNARHEDIATIAGWGEKKVQHWCHSVREPFRIQRSAKRGMNLENLVGSQPVSRAPTLSRDVTRAESDVPAKSPGAEDSLFVPAESLPSRPVTSGADADQRPPSRLAEHSLDAPRATNTAVPAKRMATESNSATEEAPKKHKQDHDPLSDGVMAALSKLRKT
ncbi:Mating-type switching protein swi10 [Fulvia fulva]|uniref:Mating-type switching protein swi10 n=1 Tax=Passalora fulva TaxID=5499 RepID=A0A9Q8L580_PASFU|nr:Mating-type switching protein swi10 [Fulvia fulva]KAK4634292.1 Mating-type switching protein swi10 [Fulvia fulva]KAK4637808.1 Mating-type switching protein swi10 [Fulvia fulva]UJO11036.1 Mating-type switching protein swi10 [Fulvia fulva]WPV09857.1 Mating-type switching protein swi10 [Fulvia fulva]WPV24383.1 Mating-type switching protein swi10 [Fulvia fulva]